MTDAGARAPVQPLDVNCPRCRRHAGQPCWAMPPGGLHPARIALAQEWTRKRWLWERPAPPPTVVGIKPSAAAPAERAP